MRLKLLIGALLLLPFGLSDSSAIAQEGPPVDKKPLVILVPADCGSSSQSDRTIERKDISQLSLLCKCQGAQAGAALVVKEAKTLTPEEIAASIIKNRGFGETEERNNIAFALELLLLGYVQRHNDAATDSLLKQVNEALFERGSKLGIRNTAGGGGGGGGGGGYPGHPELLSSGGEGQEVFIIQYNAASTGPCKAETSGLLLDNMTIYAKYETLSLAVPHGQKGKIVGEWEALGEVGGPGGTCGWGQQQPGGFQPPTPEIFHSVGAGGGGAAGRGAAGQFP